MADDNNNSGFNPWQFLLDAYQLDQNKDTYDDSKDAVNQGYLQQNPFAPYQPAMAGGFMDLLSDPGKITETPGYQFRYDQGLKGLFAKQASTGNRFSGRALTEATQFGQGLATDMYNTEVDRYGKAAGAYHPYSGGTTTGEQLSSLHQSNNFNQAYFWQNMWDRYNNTSEAPTDRNGPGPDGR